MTESTAVIAPPPVRSDENPNISLESEIISIPPLDPVFLSTSDPTSMEISDLELFLDDGDFDFSDIDFSFDNSDDFFNFSVDMEPPAIAETSPESVSDLGSSGDRGSEVTENQANMEPSGTRGSKGGSSEGVSDTVHSQVSSHDSMTFVPGVCDTVDALSPDSKNLGFQQKSGRNSVSKRKKEKGDAGDQYRSCKYSKADEKSATTSEEDDKRKVRLIKNRESAQLSRLRKKQYVEELQGKVKSMHSTIAGLNNQISYVMAENAALRQQMAAAAGVPMNPYMAGPPLPYQWMQYPHPVRASQIPVFPIPKLKTQPILSCRPKKPEIKKKEHKSKLKKVASISFIGIMFLIFLFGALVPFVKYGGNSGTFNRESNYEVQRYYDEHKGKVLMVGDHSNGSDVGRACGISEGKIHSSGKIHVDGDSCGVQRRPGSLSNTSEPLFASLYVPRNDGLVKIDGNLIINSVLVSEKALASRKNVSETIESKETELTVRSELSSALAVPEIRGKGVKIPDLYRNPEGQHSKALSAALPEGKGLHQWFLEGGSGTLMDYSMCTEVFQFDIAPGAIVPSSVSSDSKEHLQNITHDKKMNRRLLQELPVSLVTSELNTTGTQSSRDVQNSSFHGNNNKPKSSSMVVSVLLDPREAVDPETDLVMAPKSLTRIFVVVLLDSVKYVTYSCVLSLSGLHLMTT